MKYILFIAMCVMACNSLSEALFDQVLNLKSNVSIEFVVDAKKGDSVSLIATSSKGSALKCDVYNASRCTVRPRLVVASLLKTDTNNGYCNVDLVAPCKGRFTFTLTNLEQYEISAKVVLE